MRRCGEFLRGNELALAQMPISLQIFLLLVACFALAWHDQPARSAGSDEPHNHSSRVRRGRKK